MAAAAAASQTASTHRTTFVHGTHLFDISGYGAVKKLGNTVTSGTFRVAGRDWNVVCGFDPQRNALSDVSLEMAEKEDADGHVDYQDFVTVMVWFSIDDPTGGRKPMRLGIAGSGDDDKDGTMVLLTYTSRFYTVDVPQAQSDKLEARYVKDDRLRIRCAVDVLEVESGPARYCFVAAPPPPDITRFLRVLLDSGQHADVTFAVDGSCVVDAHKLVLAMRSPVFRAKFFGGSRDSSLEWFRVHDVSAPAFRAMLHFIYTDELLELELEGMMTAQDLLVAADLYGLDRLRLMCERMLWERVRADGVGTAISTLSLVNGRGSCRQLQDLCIGYVADNWEAATATDEYRELMTTCPALLNDVLEDVITKQLLMHGHGHGHGHGGRPANPSSTTTTPTPTQRSASVYRPSEVWRGTHQLTILGHSVVRRTHGSGEFIRSGAFEVCGHEWRLLYYPSGYDDDEEHVGHEAVFLQLQTPVDADVVLEASGTIDVVVSSSSSDSKAKQAADDDLRSMGDFFHRFTNDEPVQGCRQLSISSLVGPDDSLTLECSFEFQQVAAPAAGNKNKKLPRGRLLAQEQDVVVPPPSISWHLERLLESGVGWDVTFSVEDGEFHAHTLVVNERAPALLRLTAPGAEEAPVVVKSKKKKKKKQNKQKDTKMTIWIDGIKAVVLKALLHFVYTDELPPTDDLVRAAKSSTGSTTRLAGDLLAAAERFHLVDRMRPLCENLLCELITPENAAATLELARRHGRPELRAFCLHYMTSPGVFKAVVATEGYHALPADAVRDIVTQLAH